MTLGELIAALEAEDPNLVLPHGFLGPHSYRGYYDELAFEPAQNVRVRAMLADARAADGATYQGWKGGEYAMNRHTDCWLAVEGCLGETLGPTLLALMIGAGKPADTTALATDQHAATRDERARIAADLESRAKAIEDTNGENRDWLAEQLATHLPTLPIGGAIQDDPRTIAIEAYRGIAFILTAEIPPAPSAPEAPRAALSATEPDARPPARISGP